MDIFRKYIAENPYYLTQHSIDSFDTFTLDGIKKAILEKEHPVRVLKKRINYRQHSRIVLICILEDEVVMNFTMKNLHNIPIHVDWKGLTTMVL